MSALRTLTFTFSALLLSVFLVLEGSSAAAEGSTAADDFGEDAGAAVATDTGEGETSAPELPSPFREEPLPPTDTEDRGLSYSDAVSCGEAETCSSGTFLDGFARFGPAASCHHGEDLYDAPCIFGGSYSPPMTVLGYSSGSLAYAGLPLAGGAGRLNVADNNKSLTEDRFFFLYNHFQNALSAYTYDVEFGWNNRNFSLDRYTIGFEKAFLDHQWSLDMRLPLTGQMVYNTATFGVSGEQIGDLSIILKAMLYEDQVAAVAAGLGIEMPTGGDVAGFMMLTNFWVNNEAVYLHPFLGVLRAPDDRRFFQAFLSLDIPTGGNTIDYDDYYLGPGTVGRFTPQTLLHVDLAGGYWLYRNRCAPFLTGVAAVLELHYTSTLQDADTLAATGAYTLLGFTERSDRIDVFDFTVGMHADLADHTVCRVGAAFPFRDENNRSFTAAVLAQIERRF